MGVAAGPADAAIIEKKPVKGERGVFLGLQAKDWGWLAPCKDVKKYNKRFKDNLYKLTTRQKKYPKDSVVIPALMFLYTAGWIGWAGRSYLLRTRDPMKEVNLDAALALTCMASGFAWPVAAWQEIVNGKLVVKDADLPQTGLANGY